MCSCYVVFPISIAAISYLFLIKVSNFIHVPVILTVHPQLLFHVKCRPPVYTVFCFSHICLRSYLQGYSSFRLSYFFQGRNVPTHFQGPFLIQTAHKPITSFKIRMVKTTIKCQSTGSSKGDSVTLLKLPYSCLSPHLRVWHTEISNEYFLKQTGIR